MMKRGNIKKHDPLQHSALSNVSEVENLKFAKIQIPQMKSVYWRYFGFPTNEHDRIITKQNVVCTLCHKVLRNHGNTTNFRGHLQHRHKDIFKSMCTENGIMLPARKPQHKSHAINTTGIKSRPPQRKIKLELQSTNQDSSNNDSIATDEQPILFETMVPMIYDDDEIIDSDHFAKVEVGGGIDVGHNSSTSKIKKNNTAGGIQSKRDQMESKSTSDVIKELDSYKLRNALVNLIVQDLRNVNSLYDVGMSDFVRALSGNMVIPSEKKIETFIRELYSGKLKSLTDQIKINSQVKPYSLGFEIWKNVENKHFLSIYYNYTTDAPDYRLLNQLYCTLEYNKFTSMDSIFEDFNLENCTVAIVSYDYDDYLKHYLRSKNVPIILSYDIIVNKCLKSVFAIPAVASIIDEVKEVTMRYTSEINSKDVEIPTINDDFPWTHFELLKFFSETVSWPTNVDILVSSAKIIADTLSPLSVILDTLKGEEIPHSSMLSPITSKILNKKLAINNDDDDFVANIKTIIAEELHKLVLADNHLTISALLDPRFHRLTNVNNLSSCLKILKAKINKIREQDGLESKTAKDSNAKLTTSTAKKSNLELFFDVQESSHVPVICEEADVENDLKRYRNEVYVSLDESPFSWWNKMGNMYGCLKQLASLYQCVPCVVNMSFKKSVKQQIHEHQKRFMLAGNLINAILFLHDSNKCNF